jgi:hypothetical protein
MNRHASSSTLPNLRQVDLSATQRRLLLAREQCASQSSAECVRSATLIRRWPQPRTEQKD